MAIEYGKSLERTTKQTNDLVKALGKASASFKMARNSITGLGSKMLQFGGVTGILGLGALESAVNTLGEIQTAAIGATRAFGSFENVNKIQNEIVKGAMQLGIQYQQYAEAIKNASKYHSQVRFGNELFLKGVKLAAQFGEAIGGSAEMGAEMFGLLTGKARLSIKEFEYFAGTMLELQNAIGMSAQEMQQLSESITPVLGQLRDLGATEGQMESTLEAVQKFSLGFAAMGKNAGEAGQFIDRILNPERLQENVALFNQLGVSVSGAYNAMSGAGSGEFLEDVMDRLPELARRVKGMGKLAGAQYAKMLGIEYRDLIRFAEMDNEQFQKQMKEEAAKRKKEERFQKQFEQSTRTWKKWLVGFTQTLDMLKIEFLSIFRADNFTDLKGMAVDFAKGIMGLLRDLRFGDWIKMGIQFLNFMKDLLLNVLRPVSKEFGNLFETNKVQNMRDSLLPVFQKIGNIIAKMLVLLPKAVEMLAPIVGKIAEYAEKIIDFASDSKTGLAVTLAGAGAAKFAPEILSGLAKQFFDRGSPTNPMYVIDMSSGFGRFKGLKKFNRAKNLSKSITAVKSAPLNPKNYRSIMNAPKATMASRFTTGLAKGGGGLKGIFNGLKRVLPLFKNLGRLLPKLAGWLAVFIDPIINIGSRLFSGQGVGKAIWDGIGDSLKSGLGLVPIGKWLSDGLDWVLENSIGKLIGTDNVFYKFIDLVSNFIFPFKGLTKVLGGLGYALGKIWDGIDDVFDFSGDKARKLEITMKGLGDSTERTNEILKKRKGLTDEQLMKENDFVGMIARKNQQIEEQNHKLFMRAAMGEKIDPSKFKATMNTKILEEDKSMFLDDIKLMDQQAKSFSSGDIGKQDKFKMALKKQQRARARQTTFTFGEDVEKLASGKGSDSLKKMYAQKYGLDEKGAAELEERMKNAATKTEQGRKWMEQGTYNLSRAMNSSSKELRTAMQKELDAFQNEKLTEKVDASFEGYRTMRTKIMDEVKKGIISPEQARASLEALGKSLKMVSEGALNEINTMSAEIASAAGGWFVNHGAPEGFDEEVAKMALQKAAKDMDMSGLTTASTREQFTGALRRALAKDKKLFYDTTGLDKEKAAEVKASYEYALGTMTQELVDKRFAMFKVRAGAEEERKKTEAEMKKLMTQVSHNTGNTAKNTEKIEKNTRPSKPIRQLDLTALSIRAQEGESIYIGYDE